MKEMILLLCGIVIGRQLMAQTFSEWFRQNHTQLKYLAEQIAALKTYNGVLKKVYKVAWDGLNDIGSICEGDLGEHTQHFAELDRADAGIQGDATVQLIQQYFGGIAILAGHIEDAAARRPSYPVNLPALGAVVAGNLRNTVAFCQQGLAELLATDEYRMDDAARLRGLNKLLMKLKSLYGQCLSLLAELEYVSLNPAS